MQTLCTWTTLKAGLLQARFVVLAHKSLRDHNPPYATETYEKSVEWSKFHHNMQKKYKLISKTHPRNR